ncbi:MAG: hypothetical protein ACRD1I_08480 [Terriglobia bacterium]
MKELNSDRTQKPLSQLIPWALLAVSVVLAGVCMRAEERGLWFQAQTSLGIILALISLAALIWWRAQREKRAVSPEVAIYQQTLYRLLLFFAVGIIAILFNAIRYEHWVEGLVSRAAGFGILIAGSAFIIGVLFGFLFGFPSRSDDQSSSGGAPSKSLLYNTNLEEISEWLTKVILGASLVELNKLPPLVSELSTYIARAVEPRNFHAAVAHSATSPTSAPVAMAILGYFWSCGLLYGYIYTKYEVAATSQGTGNDAPALAAVDKWFSQPPGPNDEKARVAMMNAIKVASIAAKVRIFLKAEKYRKASTEEVNGRSLPVFQALVEADTQEVFHRNRSQYALALMGRKKDPKNPDDDWHRALDLLDDAIRIRDQSRDPGWQEYEEARAECQRHLNPKPAPA